jgi:serine/threonine protein kinase/tetratricopeptide (TPR) repeat protein
MGEVYRARDPRLDRDVAIKVLPSSLVSDPDRLRRFEQEARAAGLLNHPNVTAVYDVGSHEGAPYVVSELLEGKTLRDELAGGSLSARRALDYAVQMARGLAAAHEKGIVHRDLKPDNVFVTRDGRVKILDFGLARFLERPLDAAGREQAAASDHPMARQHITALPTEALRTEAGVVLGTLNYMAPEQVRGEPTDARSDIFSFGGVLYEMLAGRPAFARTSGAETISAILREDPRDFAASDGVPPGLDRIVRHCLEKDPERRFQSARDLVFGLEAISDLSGSAAAAPAARSAAPRWPWISGAAAALLAAAVLLLWRGKTGRPGPTEASASNRKSIAVLPFQNLSPEAENAYFADGMTEDILTQLAKIRDLKVISHASVMQYKGTKKPIPAIASELGVATVLEGSVRRAGNRVRITGKLIDARSDEHLWAETYDRDLKDVFAIQSEVAQQIAAALRAALSPAEKKRIEQSPTRNLAVYDLYLKGRELYNHYVKADNEEAIGLFQKALELDPGFAPAYAGLADAYAQGPQRFGMPQSFLATSLEMSRKAIALDPELAEGHKALGLVYFVRAAYRESLEASRRAVEINPNHQPAITNIGFALWSTGKPDEALPWLRRAVELDPAGIVALAGLSGCYATLGDAAEAERGLKRAQKLQPRANQAFLFLPLVYLGERRDEDALRQAREALVLAPDDARLLYLTGVAELVTGHPDRARPLFEQSLSRLRGTRVGNRILGAGAETNLAYLHLRAGERGPAARLLEESLATNRQAEKDGNQDWSVPFDTACVHALRGEKDEAFRWLDKSIETGWRGWPLGTRSPLLDPLRSDARFKQLESRLAELVRQARRNAGLP